MDSHLIGITCPFLKVGRRFDSCNIMYKLRENDFGSITLHYSNLYVGICNLIQIKEEKCDEKLGNIEGV